MKKNVVNFFKFLSFIQAIMNNSVNVFTETCSNEILYDFKMLKITDLLNNNVAKVRTADDNSVIVIKEERTMLKKKIEKSINHAQTMMKSKYDSRYRFIKFEEKQKMFIKFHKEYTQSDLKNKKYNKQ